ncbi:tyrosine-type recombinase/integrase [Streptomyces sp. MAR4 CNX-425]|uniref:tyrosine-type recombinase/integrase n=1 Tax=Streptomyces sp. MAR4 CNX-425 TaxID=3406343 RepID=UPI003B5045CE
MKFPREDGNPLRPDDVSKLFADLVDEVRFDDDAHLPDEERRRLRRVRLHDLRHGQASLMLAAGVDMATVSKRLGHSSISITSDTYSHLLGGVGRDAADRASALVPRRRRAASSAPTDGERDRSVTTSPTDSPDEIAPESTEPPQVQVSGCSDAGTTGRPRGTRTHNQRITRTHNQRIKSLRGCQTTMFRRLPRRSVGCRILPLPAGQRTDRHAVSACLVPGSSGYFRDVRPSIGRAERPSPPGVMRAC